MITIKHRTASGRLDACWEVDSSRGVIEVVLRLGSARPIASSVRVCHPDRPRLWAHPILRLDGESWRILPAIFVPAQSTSRSRMIGGLMPRDCSMRSGGVAGAIPCDLHAAIGPQTHLILTNAPPEQDRELEELSA